MRPPEEQFCDVGDVRLCYESRGSEDDPALLLIMGLGFQLIAWPDGLIDGLVARGYRVIRFDNRDAGRSTHLVDRGSPTRWELITRRIRNPSYTLEDMAGDAIGLLDCLGIERAHVVGASMGGMIAQAVAAIAPDRVLSLTSIMSMTGARWTGQPSVRLLPYLLVPPPADRDAYIAQTTGVLRRIRSPGFPADEAASREVAEMTFDRGIAPGGFGRQLGAIVASGDRTRALARITSPTLVIHGTKDRLVAPSGGRATAKAIPGAELELIEGMGHDMPRDAWPRLIDAIDRNARRSSQAAASSR
jgi:pimeloyl-ACP methyl ester carboxylesterase